MNPHAHSAGAAGAASAPNFLLRGPRHQTIRWPIVGSSALLLGGVMVAAVMGAALGAYLVFADDPAPSADATHIEPPLASVQHNPPVAAPPSVKSDAEQALTETLLEKSDISSPSEGDPHAPRVVRTEPFQPDPSVWTTVRKFLPLPPDQVPILDLPPVQPPTAAPAVPDTPTGAGALHEESARAHPHHRHRVRTHTRVGRSRTQAGGGAPSEVGGTRMTADQVRRDGSKNQS
jgi:hypothetical protein